MNVPLLVTVGIGVAAAVIFYYLGWFMARKIGHGKIARADEIAANVIREAEKEAQIKKKEAILEAKDEWYKAKVSFERELQVKRSEFQKTERKLLERESALDRKVDVLSKKEREYQSKERTLQTKEKAVGIREKELENLISIQNEQLERVAGMTSEEAKKILMENLQQAARLEAAAKIKEILEEAERTAEKEAREIIIGAIYRCAADHTVESTVSVVNLPHDELKGRIIGRDDTPEAVILSGYDPVKREVARLALEKLVADGRIHPARIEEVVEKTEKEIEVKIREAGEQSCFDVGIHGLHRDIIWLMGKLHFRTSYGQHVLQHSVEVSTLCGIMAAELGLDPVIAKRAGLLHDIGKAIDRDTEGTHTQIGVDFLKKYNEIPEVLNAVEAHHGDVPALSPYPVLVQAADAISGARPGARREPLEGYIKRLEKLEELADSFHGVAKAFAIQAGREIRVIVENNEVDDVGATLLASDIAKKIQGEMEYPGQIKVTVIRETRAIDYAK